MPKKSGTRIENYLAENCLPMKQIYTTLMALLLVATSFATNDKTKSNGDWSTSPIWNLNRTPLDNDTIIISAGDTVEVTNNIQLNNVAIFVYGVLDFSGGKLKLDNASKVIVVTAGKITGNGSNDQIQIGSNIVYKVYQ